MKSDLRLVIIEDDSALNELMKRRLSKKGYHCICFHNARSAIEWFTSNVDKADLAIIDLVLPDYSGAELIEMLHSNNIKIPFIVATGQGSETVAVKMLKKGARDYLVKDSEFLDVLPATVEMIWKEVQLENLLNKAREQIQIQNATLNTIYNFSPDGILAINERDEIVTYNKELLSLWNISSEKMKSGGEAFFDIATKTTNNKVVFKDLISKISSDFTGLVHPSIPLNNKILELYAAVMTQDDSNNFKGRVWYFRDITTHIQAQKTLEQAKKDVEEHAKLRNQFFAIVSHDVKTPLNSILGFSNMLYSTDLDEKQKKYIANIATSGEYMLGLIKNIIDFNKIENDMFEFSMQPLSLTEIIESCIEIFKSVIVNDKKNVDLKYHIDENVPKIIKNDALRLKQIISNLLGNAIKFTKDGEVSLSCSYNPQKKEVKVDVYDTGIGIPSDVIDTIFSPFVQGDSGIIQKYGGSGLGLAITKLLVEKMGGAIIVESNVNQYTKFSFTIIL